MPGRDDDLDWLYGRDRRPAAGAGDRGRRTPRPQSTKVMPAADPTARGQRPGDTRTSGSARAAGGAAAPVRPRPAPAPRGSVPADSASRPVSRRRPGGPGDGGGGGGRGGGGGGSGPRPRRRRHPVRTTLAILIVLVVAAGVWLVAVPVSAFGGAEHVNSAVSGKRPGQQPGTTYLMVGSDSRAGMSAKDKKKLGTGTVAGQRTDTIMLLDVPATGKPVLLSIPRDSYVPIPGHGKNKINAAFSFGGAPLLIKTIEHNTGIRVDHYVEIGFDGFVDMVEAVNGVPVCLKKPMKDKKAHISLPAGCQTLNGPKALGYVRARYSDPMGDLGRVQRQRQVVGAIMKKAISPATVLNPVRYWNLTHAAAGSVALGDDTGFTAMPALAIGLRKVSNENGYTLTVPLSDTNLSTPAGDAVQWDAKKSKELFNDIIRGDTSAVSKFVQKH